MDINDNQFMRRALELAGLGRGRVSPNPMAGCVVVSDERIIGEGFHQQYGGAHAEVNAINDVGDRSLLPGSALYVTLEPCAHFGKTPPCADLLIRKAVKKVVIAVEDPHEKVNGKGIERLVNAGITVEKNVLRDEARELNKRFFTYCQKKRPYVILKWAQTSDGFIARRNFDSKWISSEYSRQLVHKWRTEEDAVLVGKNTVIHDNPSLTSRDWHGKNPVRILIDKNLEAPENFKLFNDDSRTLIFNLRKEAAAGSNEWIKPGTVTIPAVMEQLYQRNIQSVLAEGGARLLNSLIANNCWDEARIFTSRKIFQDGIPAPVITGTETDVLDILGDRLRILKNNG